MPVMIDKMLEVTGHSRAFYVGHSQGTSTCLAFLSTRPEYNSKIIQAHLLAPAAFMRHMPHPLVSGLMDEVRRGFFEDYKYLQLDSVVRFAIDFSRMFCTERQRVALAVCSSVIFAITGPNRHGNEMDTVCEKKV